MLVISVSSCQKKEAIYPSKGTIVEAVYGLGTVESDNVFHAKAAMVTFVEEFFVKEGQDVKKGDKLYSLQGGTMIKSPLEGRVTSIPVTIRENLFPQTIILTVIDLKNIFLSVSLDQEAALRIKNGMKSEATFEFFRNSKLLGAVESIYSQDDQFIAKVRFENWPQGILTGMTADVSFEIDRKEDALLVPTQAIVNGFLTIKREKKKNKMKVEIGLKDEEKAEILSPEIGLTDEVVMP
jgi:membrane fusion protein, macrolide-specific efflux system